MAAAKPSSSRPKPPPLDEPATPRKAGKLRWLLGWVVTPLLLLSLLFLGGVHVGARNPDMWLARATLWMFSKQAGLGPTSAADQRPMAERMRLAALPKQDIALRLSLTRDDLGGFASELHTKIDDLKCEDVCRIHWQAEQPEREFFDTRRCELTPATDDKPAKIECDAIVQRELEDKNGWLPDGR